MLFPSCTVQYTHITIWHPNNTKYDSLTGSGVVTSLLVFNRTLSFIAKCSHKVLTDFETVHSTLELTVNAIGQQ